MEAKQRLPLKVLESHPWLNPEEAPSTPLTGCVLGQRKIMASAIKQTFHAFYEATRTGFTLGDVSRAPLAKRRQNKRGSSPMPGARKMDREDMLQTEKTDNGKSVSSSISSSSDGISHTRPSRLNLGPFSC